MHRCSSTIDHASFTTGRETERRGEERERRERKEKERKKTGVINKAAAQLLHTDKAERLAMRETKVNFDGRLRPTRAYTRVHTRTHAWI